MITLETWITGTLLSIGALYMVKKINANFSFNKQENSNNANGQLFAAQKMRIDTINQNYAPEHSWKKKHDSAKKIQVYFNNFFHPFLKSDSHLSLLIKPEDFNQRKESFYRYKKDLEKGFDDNLAILNEQDQQTLQCLFNEVNALEDARQITYDLKERILEQTNEALVKYSK